MIDFNLKKLCCGAISGAVLAGSMVGANAATISNNMSCSQAVAVYDRAGRINTRTRSGVILPIYNGVPKRDRGRLLCGFGSSASPVFVIARDTPRCVIAYRCG